MEHFKITAQEKGQSILERFLNLEQETSRGSPCPSSTLEKAPSTIESAIVVAADPRDLPNEFPCLLNYVRDSLVFHMTELNKHPKELANIFSELFQRLCKIIYCQGERHGGTNMI